MAAIQYRSSGNLKNGMTGQRKMEYFEKNGPESLSIDFMFDL